MTIAIEVKPKKKSRRWLLWGLALLICLCGAGAAAIFGSKPGTPVSATDTAIAVAATNAPTAAPILTLEPKAAFEAALNNALGSSNRNVPRITEVKYGEPTAEEINVVWAINDNLTEGLIKSGAKSDAAKILKTFAQSGLPYSGILMNGSFPMKDVYGNEKEDLVVNLTFTGATIAKINWDGFDSGNIYKIADLAAVLPAFRD